MKIGYLLEQGIDTRKRPFSGPANHVRHVTLHLQSRGHQVRLLNRLHGQIWKSDDLESYEPVHVAGVDAGPARLVESGVRRGQAILRLPYFAWFEGRRFAAACRQELAGFDLLYQRKSWMGFGGGMAAKSMGVPLILEENGDHLLDLEAKGMAPTGLQRDISLRLMERAMWRADHVIASGEGWRRRFIERWAYDPERVTTIENGTGLLDLLSREDCRAFTEGDGRKEMVLVYVGGFYAWHGIPVLLPALARVRESGLPVRLLLIGSRDGMDEARTAVSDLGLSGAVTFAGQLPPEAYAPLLAQADVGLSPYCGWPEYSGLKILDYKAAGLPTIGSGEDGMPPTLTDGETGLIVPPCDEDALFGAICRLAKAPDTRRRMGRQARLEAEEKHSWAQTAARIEAVIGQVMGGRGAGGQGGRVAR
jgi:glycosyltransferase involved in cell wall biosynthesis